MKKVLSFDFDGTLTRPDVQNYCQIFLSCGFDIHVVTTRYDELHKHLWANNPTNEDMYLITDKIGIKRENIHFMNFKYGKGAFLLDTNAIFHLDDDERELNGFHYTQITKPISVLKSDWSEQCDKAIIDFPE